MKFYCALASDSIDFKGQHFSKHSILVFGDQNWKLPTQLIIFPGFLGKILIILPPCLKLIPASSYFASGLHQRVISYTTHIFSDKD